MFGIYTYEYTIYVVEKIVFFLFKMRTWMFNTTDFREETFVYYRKLRAESFLAQKFWEFLNLSKIYQLRKVSRREITLKIFSRNLFTFSGEIQFMKFSCFSSEKFFLNIFCCYRINIWLKMQKIISMSFHYEICSKTKKTLGKSWKIIIAENSNFVLRKNKFSF